MKQVNIHEAKTHLSRLIEEVEAGEDIVIARSGHPVVRLVAMDRAKPVVLGSLKGHIVVPEDFDDPLPSELLDAFEGRTH
jgi:prevent-host-death family protein